MPPQAETPEWAKDAIFYQIFPDRFAASERVEKPTNLESWESPPTMFGFKGGDLLGVVEKLDYLQDLGVNAIYFNPIFQSAANHRYHTHDYFKVDPILGGDAAFDELIEQAHNRDIRIVLDGVFNHASRGFFQFNHILENEADSPYLDWFFVHDYPLNAYQGAHRYEAWAGLPALPKFNTDNPQVRNFIFDVARYWLDRGIDGWRLDVPFEIDDDEFWQEFRRVVKEANPEAYLVGEVAWEAQRWLQGDQFDAVMNYQFTQLCVGFFARGHIDRSVEKNLMGLGETPVFDGAGFLERAGELLALYPEEISLVQFNLLDSHDMPRFITLASGDQASLRLAALFQMTYPGAPCIYYGDEIGVSGGQSGFAEASRKSFPWDRSQWDLGLLDYYRRIITMRRAHPALRRGAFIPLFGEGQVAAFLRRLEDETLIVLFNGEERAFELHIPAAEHLPEATNWVDLLGGGRAQVSEGSLRGPAIPARTGAVFAVEF